jgi:hypothetical protein
VFRSPFTARAPRPTRTAARLLRATRLRTIAVATALTLMASLTTTSPAHAFAVPKFIGSDWNTVRYTVEQNFFDAFYAGGQDRSAVHTADQAWTAQDLWLNVRFLDFGGPGIIRRWFGAGNGIAQAFGNVPGSFACRGDLPGPCIIEVNPEGHAWNTLPGNNTRPGWLDLTGTLVHEMGHWAGIDHSCDHPSSDGGAIPSVACYYTEGADDQRLRTIQADDVNALKVARPTGNPGFRNILANDAFTHQGLAYSQFANGFWFTDPGWGGAFQTGWGKLGGGFVDRNCNAAHQPASAPCFMAIGAGSGSSLYQDVAIWDGNYIRGYALSPNVRLRAPFDGVWGSASLVIWNLDTGQNVYQRNCVLPPRQWIPSSSTSQCWGSTYLAEPPGTWLRFEIYNTSNTNLDIDDTLLGF